MKSKKTLISKIFICVGIILIIAYAFLPIFHFDSKKLYDDVGELSGGLLSLAGIDISGEFAGTILEYAIENGDGDETFDMINSISMSTFFFPGDKAAEMIEINTSTDDWQQVTSVLRGIGFTVYIIPIVMFAAAAVLFFINKGKKTALGLVISNAVYVITFNVFICIILNNAINSALNQLDPSMSRYAGMSFLPFLLVFAGAIICVVFSVLTVIWEKDTTKAIAAKAKAQLIGISGQFAGSSIPLEDNRPVIIGREGQYASVVVDSDTKVSRKHCQVMYDAAQDKVFVTDFSSNGTRLGDGTRLPQNTSMPVNRGTIIVLSPETKFSVK